LGDSFEIHLCDNAWKLYDKGTWEEYLRHREECDECTKPSEVAYAVKNE